MDKTETPSLKYCHPGSLLMYGTTTEATHIVVNIVHDYTFYTKVKESLVYCRTWQQLEELGYQLFEGETNEKLELCKRCDTMKHVNDEGLCGRCANPNTNRGERLKINTGDVGIATANVGEPGSKSSSLFQSQVVLAEAIENEELPSLNPHPIPDNPESKYNAYALKD